MTGAERAATEAALTSERAQAQNAVSSLDAEHTAIVEGAAHANLDDEHDPEGATVGFERALVAGLLDAARQRITQIDEAFDRLAAGTYGVCERCGGPIGTDRLEAQPAAATCFACAAAATSSPLRRRGGAGP